MRRRTVLIGASTAALSGCLGSVWGLDDDDPEAVTEAWGEAILNGNPDRVRELAHPDGPYVGRINDRTIRLNPGAEGERFVDEVGTLEVDDTEAAVRIAFAARDSGAEAVIFIADVTLRREGEAWRVWEVEQASN